MINNTKDLLDKFVNIDTSAEKRNKNLPVVKSDDPDWKMFQHRGGEADIFFVTTYLNNRHGYKYVGRLGEMNRPYYNIYFMAILHEGNTLKEGVYVVYLLSEDHSKLYLTLAIGVTNERDIVSKVSRIRNDLRSEITSKGLCEGPITVTGSVALAGKYEESVICYKEYEKGRMPENEELEKDLNIFLNLYDKYESQNKQILNSGQKYNIDQGIFDNSKAIVFFGPPGTGKTRRAKIEAVRLVTGNNELAESDALDVARLIIGENIEGNDEYDALKGRICLVQFHPGYSYNDFMETISVGSSDYSDRVFKEFAKRAASDNNNPYIIIIDEINRANVSEVLGELLYGIEYRNEEITTGISGNLFSVPDNLYIIGTMNTADRSLQSLDYAVRRRFVFCEVKSENPKAFGELKGDEEYYKISANMYFIKTQFETVCKDINESVARGIRADDIMPGVSYYIVKADEEHPDRYDEGHFEYKIKYELIPLLKEYIKDGMFTKRKKIAGEKSLIELIQKNEYYDRLLDVKLGGNPEE